MIRVCVCLLAPKSAFVTLAYNNSAPACTEGANFRMQVHDTNAWVCVWRVATPDWILGR